MQLELILAAAAPLNSGGKKLNAPRAVLQQGHAQEGKQEVDEDEAVTI